MNSTLVISHKPFKKAVAAVRTAHDYWAAINAEMADLPSVTFRTHGTNGMAERAALMEQFAAKKARVSAYALETVKEAADEWREGYVSSFMPHGADAADPDFRMLELNLVATPDELRRVLDKHSESVLFQRMGERYAAAREWADFTVPPWSAAIEDFAQTMFRRLAIAAKNPDGYEAECFASDGELERVAEICGVLDEWNAGE